MSVRRSLAWAGLIIAISGCGPDSVGLMRVARAQAPLPSPGPPVVPAVPPQQPTNQNPLIKQTVFEAVGEPFPGTPDTKVSVRIRAQVNGIPILEEEVRDACYPYLMATMNLPEPERGARQSQIFREELQQIIDREILLQDAFARLGKGGNPYLDKLKAAAGKEFDKMVRSMKTRAGVKTDDQLKEFLRSQGQSMEGIRRQVERNFMAREYLRSRVFPAIERIGHEQIVEYYQDHMPEFQVSDSVKWQDVFIDASRFANRDEARRFAETLATNVRSGQDFSKVMQYDNGDSSYRKGEGFGQRHGEIRPAEAEPVLFGMHDGEVGPLVELPTGFHVIRLVKREYAGTLPLNEKTQEEIRRKLQMQVFEKETKRLVADLREKATIEVAK
jgi:peptidyl-prolyl cis-trans isomerase SurA